jgi:polyribonucleotide nucleotidyltransferase
MVEAGANQLSEETMLDCIWSAHEEIQKLIAAQRELFREKGVEKPSGRPPSASRGTSTSGSRPTSGSRSGPPSTPSASSSA